MSTFQEQEYSKQRFDFSLWRKLCGHILVYRRELITVGCSMLALAGVETTFPLLTAYAVDNFIVPGTTEGISGFATLYAILVLLQGSVIWLFIERAARIETGVGYDIRRQGFARLQELSPSYYNRTPVGWIMARMTSDVLRLSETIAWGLVDMVWGGARMLMIALAMFYLNWQLALITLSVIPVLLLLSLYFQKRILRAFREVRRINSRITGAFNEGITGARTTKTLVREEKNTEEFQKITAEMRTHSIRAAIFSALYLPLALSLGSIGTGLALWFGGEGVIAGFITYGTLVAFLSYSVQFFEPVRELARIFAEFQSAQAAAERVLSLLATTPEIIDPAEVTEKYGDILCPQPKNWPELLGDVAFRSISFTYPDGEQVLCDFDLDVRAGESVALVGSTGSGKSTIINLLCRFYEPQSGEVLIDGVDYRRRSQSWLHSHLGYVLQSPHLFSGTIAENIRYGRLDADNEEIRKAAELVSAHEFITGLEKGYNTEVGEGGDRLSTGQKQLISFARAIIGNPRLLILDEATSSIDPEMEQLIQQAIGRILKGRTSFIIAHRLSTIRSADRILVIRKGKIIEEGNHEELLSKRGYYWKLHSKQKAGSGSCQPENE